MPRGTAKIRRRFVEGVTEVLPWDTEETLVYGYPLVFDTYATMKNIDQWRVAWSRWRDVILPKVIEHRPGTRPVAMYVLHEIEPRELTITPPADQWYKHIDIHHPSGRTETHWLDAPPPFMAREVDHLRRLGIVTADELRRHREWMKMRNPECDTCAIDTYPLEQSLYE